MPQKIETAGENLLVEEMFFVVSRGAECTSRYDLSADHDNLGKVVPSLYQDALTICFTIRGKVIFQLIAEVIVVILLIHALYAVGYGGNLIRCYSTLPSAHAREHTCKDL